MNKKGYIIESKKTETDSFKNISTRKKNTSNKNDVIIKEKGLIKNNFNIKAFFKEWIIPICSAIIVAFLINKFLIYNVYIPSESMVPTLNVGDKLIVSRIYNPKKIKRGDIDVFYSKELNEVLIKRVIGIPGDHIEIHDGIVNINGEDVNEYYVKNNEEFDGVFDVPNGKYFFLGDNRSNSNDSRKWINPYIDESEIQGRALMKFYPIKDFGSIS